MKNLINNTLHLINNKESRNLLKEYLEIAIDASTDSDILKSIPLINTLTGGGKFIISVRDQLFLNKMKTFLEGLEDISQAEIDKFIQEIEKKNEKDELGEKIISLVELADSAKKSRLLGILFQMFLKKQISKDNFDLLSHCVNRLFIFDLYMLYHFGESKESQYNIDERLGSVLLGCGLVSLEIDQKKREYIRIGPPNKSETTVMNNYYKINKWGEMLRPAIGRLIDLQNPK
jgi:hypothetical protein